MNLSVRGDRKMSSYLSPSSIYLRQRYRSWLSVCQIHYESNYVTSTALALLNESVRREQTAWSVLHIALGTKRAEYWGGKEC